MKIPASISGDFVLLPLSKGKAFTIVDRDQPYGFGWIFRVSWHIHKSRDNVYARAEFRGKKIFLHRALMKCPRHLVVDHINGNSLDNRRENLRRCRHSTNNKNRCPSWIERAKETRARNAQVDD